jgi:hypothetical protein
MDGCGFHDVGFFLSNVHNWKDLKAWMERYSLLIFFGLVLFTIFASALAEILYRRNQTDDDELPSYLVERQGPDRPVITREQYQPRRKV